MPCKDITETIRVEVDTEDRFGSYALAKRTCGQGVGGYDLLLPYLRGKHVDDILKLQPEDLLNAYPPQASRKKEAETLEFLYLKHLFAVQSVLEVYVGQASGAKNETCAASEIEWDGESTEIEAVIRVDVVIEKIKACGGCGSCGSERSPKKRAAKTAATS